VKTTGRTIKNNNSQILAKRIMASFQAIAKIFFIGYILALSGVPSASRGT
jgi:hypothetical protein